MTYLSDCLLETQNPLKTPIGLPDYLIERLTSAGLFTDEGISRLLDDALSVRETAANPLLGAYRTLFEQVHDAVFIVAPSGQIISINHRAVELTGFPADELLTYSFRELSANVDASANVLQNLLDGQMYAPFERVFRKKSGETFTAEVTAQLVRGADGSPQYIQSVVRDITQRKRDEQELRDRERLLRQIIDLAPLEIFVKDAEGRYLMANQASAEAYGTTVDAIIGKTDKELSINADEAEAFTLQDRQVLETGQLLSVPESEFTDAEGRKRILRTAKMLLKFPGREEPAVLGVATDITEMKQTESELLQAYHQAYELAAERQQVRILTEFIQNTSHEFRTPLSVISTSIYLITRATDEAKRAAHVAQAAAQIKRITRLLEQLQTMAELDSGVELDFAPTDINALLREIIAVMREGDNKAGPVIQLLPNDNVPQVSADLKLLGLAFEHVLDNAVRFTPDGGMVTVATQSSPDGVTIEVRDTGIGIPYDKMEHVMRRFWRLDAAHSTPGFGLGLPIVQKIVDRHNGSLAISSQPGSGTTVTITLPAT